MQKSPSSFLLHFARKNVLASSSIRPYTKAAVPQVVKEVAEDDTESFTNTSQQRYVYKQKSVKIRLKHVTGRHVPPRPGGKPLLDSEHPTNTTLGIAKGTQQISKAKVSDKDLKDRIDYEVAQARGGYKDFTQTVGNPRDLISAPVMQSLEPLTRRVKPAPSEGQRILKTSEEWFGYDKAFPRPVEAEYMDNAKKWREGEYISQKEYVEQFTRGNTSIPIFAREKKPDPFRGQQHLIKRVSYKNLDFLLNFISPGGKIMNRRVTGVSGKAQRRIKREIKKSRFLGLIPFTANPASSLAADEATEKGLPDFHGGASINPDGRTLQTTAEHIIEQSDSLDNLYDYIGSLRKNINPDPHLDWSAATRTSNPSPNEKLINMEILGLLPHQMAQKKQKLKQLLLENIVLDRFRTLAASHPVQQLEAATTPSPAASEPAQK